jgi:phenylpropionate dioxygenase-like ring-hydroxylating dioxygenase large terminal subunit
MCTAIPMMNSKTETANTMSRAFCAQTYPTQTAGGLIWAFLDPSVPEDQLPPLPLPEEFTSNPVSQADFYAISDISFLSLIENSFDPSHAPFTHHGEPIFLGSKTIFRPENAIPVEHYRVIQEPTKADGSDGFTLEHSPYMKGQTMNTTRQIIPPCTSLTKAPLFTVAFHFVPSTPTQTRVIGILASPPQAPVSQEKDTKLGRIKNALSSRIANLAFYQKLRRARADWKHFQSESRHSAYRFYSQDRITMQGQDVRKVKRNQWRDLVPTPADRGVKTLQSWVTHYGSGGPFPLHALAGIQEGKEMTLWDKHAKDCPICRRTLSRLAHLQHKSNQAMKVSMVASVLSLLWGTCTTSVVFAKHPGRLMMGGLSAASSLQYPLLLSCVAWMMASVLFQMLSRKCYNLRRQVFVTGQNDPDLGSMKIYAH